MCYSLENLFAIINQQSIAISLIKNEENAYHTKTSTTFDFTNAREIQEILGFDKAVVSSESVSANPANITRGLNVIQLYSSITNSDSDIPIVTIKIDNPLESFHQSYETNINVKNSVLNYIDVHFRDIAGNLITLNGNITINFYFKTFDEVIFNESNNNRFNITSQITNLDNGHYSHKLSRPINLTNSKIVNANFLTNGSIYNLSTDQTVTIDGIPFIVQKGSYSLEEILSVMNSLCGAVFSYINIDVESNTNILDPLVDENNQKYFDLNDNNKNAIYDVPLGIWIYADKENDTFIELTKDDELNTYPTWSLLISSQFKPFPYSSVPSSNVNESSRLNEFTTFSEVLTKINGVLDYFTSLNIQLNELRKKIETIESSLSLIATDNTIESIKKDIDTFKINTDNKFDEINKKLINIKWSLG